MQEALVHHWGPELDQCNCVNLLTLNQTETECLKPELEAT